MSQNSDSHDTSDKSQSQNGCRILYDDLVSHDKCEHNNHLGQEHCYSLHAQDLNNIRHDHDYIKLNNHDEPTSKKGNTFGSGEKVRQCDNGLNVVSVSNGYTCESCEIEFANLVSLEKHKGSHVHAYTGGVQNYKPTCMSRQRGSKIEMTISKYIAKTHNAQKHDNIKICTRPKLDGEMTHVPGGNILHGTVREDSNDIREQISQRQSINEMPNEKEHSDTNNTHYALEKDRGEQFIARGHYSNKIQIAKVQDSNEIYVNIIRVPTSLVQDRNAISPADLQVNEIPNSRFKDSLELPTVQVRDKTDMLIARNQNRKKVPVATVRVIDVIPPAQGQTDASSKHYKSDDSRIKCFKTYRCDKCDIVFACEKDFIEHTERSICMYVCSCCNKGYISDKSFSNHMCASMKQDEFKCQICNMIFHSQTFLDSHLLNHATHKCAKSKITFPSQDDLDSHMEMHLSSTGEHTCHVCMKDCITQRSLKMHMRTHVFGKCVKCKLYFQSQEDLDSHMEMHFKSTGEHTCQVCMKDCTTQGSLKMHMRTHRPRCSICNKACKTRSSLSLHLHKEHNIISDENRHLQRLGMYLKQCNICMIFFTDKDSFALHNQSCVKYTCEICDLKFKFDLDFNCHKLIHMHAKDRPYTCEICFRSFYTESNFHSHVKFHEGKLKYNCGECGISFSGRDHLLVHIEACSVEKSYTCGVCEKVFSLQISLVAHMTIHSGEECFVCELCGIVVAGEVDFDKHTRAHLGYTEETLSCIVCETEFSLLDDLLKHLRIHTGDGLKCELCLKVFMSLGSLTKHRNEFHL